MILSIRKFRVIEGVVMKNKKLLLFIIILIVIITLTIIFIINNINSTSSTKNYMEKYANLPRNDIIIDYLLNFGDIEIATDFHPYIFIGKVGSFCPVKEGCGGGILYRENEGKYYAAAGTKGYRWLESEMVKELGKESSIDRSYYDALVDAAAESIASYGDLEWFLSDDSDFILKY